MSKRGRKRTGKVVEGFDGKFEPRPAVMVSPYLNADVKGQQKEHVTKNVRHDVLEYEFACKRIDDTQKKAGDELARLIGRAGIGGARAISYERPKVDGGSIGGDPLTDSVMAAHQRLRDIRWKIGEDDYALLVLTIGEGHSIKRVAEQWYSDRGFQPSAQNATVYLGCRFRDALTALARIMGIEPGRRIAAGPSVLTNHRALHFGA